MRIVRFRMCGVGRAVHGVAAGDHIDGVAGVLRVLCPRMLRRGRTIAMVRAGMQPEALACRTQQEGDRPEQGGEAAVQRPRAGDGGYVHASKVSAASLLIKE